LDGRRGAKGMRESNGGGKSKIHCKHICKCNHAFPVQLLYANFRKEKNNMWSTESESPGFEF
jgi:hypothetical protein